MKFICCILKNIYMTATLSNWCRSDNRKNKTGSTFLPVVESPVKLKRDILLQIKK